MATPMRTYTRITLVGFWSLLFGAVLVLLAAQFFSVMATATPAATESTVGFSMNGLAGQTLVPLFTVGAAGAVVGLLLLVVGVWLLRSLLAAPTR